MIASFYICDSSFLYNEKDTDHEVGLKILKFKEMIDEARQYSSDNKFYLNADSFLSTVILSGNFTIQELITERSMRVNRDCSNLFFSLFKICEKNKLAKKDLLEYLELEDENTCNGILVFNLQKEFPNTHQVISTINGWMRFRRYYLGKYPCDSAYFLSEIEKYYKNIRIHSQNRDKYLREILHTHSQRIVAYLEALNDHLLVDFNDFRGDFVQFLPFFASKYGIDGASFEGTKNSKFRCDFLSQEGQRIEAYCEPHLKMYKDDFGNQNMHGRIYFQSPTIGCDVIYVGFICEHL